METTPFILMTFIFKNIIRLIYNFFVKQYTSFNLMKFTKTKVYIPITMQYQQK